MTPLRTAVAALLLTCAPFAAANAADAPDLSISLAPIADETGALTRLDVAIRFEAPQPGDALAAMAVTANSVETSARSLRTMVFSDARGIVPVASEDTALDGDNIERKWKPLLPVQGPVTVAYSIPIDPAQPELAKPQYELRAGEGGLSGAGNAFLVLPADSVAREVTVHWDLSRAGSGARAVSSLGAGDSRSSRPLTSDQIGGTYYMAGRIGAYSKGPFFSAWQG
ncbi:MAG TPA: peptidase M61, partial [Novosphingobium sp.]|nr:peptidase M61 [Novosphingobium sp.]